MNRRFYCFNNLEDVRLHIAKCETLSDVYQLKYDIEQSSTNLTRFRRGVPGVYAVDFADDRPFRHVFMTRSAFEQYGEPRKDEADSFSVVKEG